MSTIYVTFGKRYAREPHPVDGRAHPDGWFEFTGQDRPALRRAAWEFLTPPGGRVPEYAYAYATPPRPDLFPRGCLARFGVTDEGRVHDMEEYTHA